MIVKKIILTCSVLLGIFCSACNADIVPCQRQPIQNNGVTLSDLISTANVVALVKATSFTENSSQSSYTGYYQFQSVSTVLGLFNPDKKIWGDVPYKEIPQQYIDITPTHNAIDFGNLYGEGMTEIVVDDKGNCNLMPRFKIGWNYLVLIGVDSTLAFEPINSPHLDQWFKKVVVESNIIKDKNWLKDNQ